MRCFVHAAFQLWIIVALVLANQADGNALFLQDERLSVTHEMTFEGPIRQLHVVHCKPVPLSEFCKELTAPSLRLGQVFAQTAAGCSDRRVICYCERKAVRWRSVYYIAPQRVARQNRAGFA